MCFGHGRLGGFYLSPGPALAAQLTGSHNLVRGGLIAFLLTSRQTRVKIYPDAAHGFLVVLDLQRCLQYGNRPGPA
jgi:hypothetical protein